MGKGRERGGEHPEPRGGKCLARSAGRAQEGFCVGFLFCGVRGRSQSAAGQGQHGWRGPVTVPGPRKWLPGKVGSLDLGGSGVLPASQNQRVRVWCLPGSAETLMEQGSS